MPDSRIFFLSKLSQKRVIWVKKVAFVGKCYRFERYIFTLFILAWHGFVIYLPYLTLWYIYLKVDAMVVSVDFFKCKPELTVLPYPYQKQPKLWTIHVTFILRLVDTLRCFVGFTNLNRQLFAQPFTFQQMYVSMHKLVKIKFLCSTCFKQGQG